MKCWVNKNKHAALHTINIQHDALLGLSCRVGRRADILTRVLLQHARNLQYLTTFTSGSDITVLAQSRWWHGGMIMSCVLPDRMWTREPRFSSCPSLVHAISEAGCVCTSHMREIMWPSTALRSSSCWPRILGGTAEREKSARNNTLPWNSHQCVNYPGHVEYTLVC